MFVERKELNKEVITSFLTQKGYEGFKVLGFFEAGSNPYKMEVSVSGWEVSFNNLEGLSQQSLLLTDFSYMNKNLAIESELPNLEKNWKELLVKTFKGEYVDAYLSQKEEKENILV